MNNSPQSQSRPGINTVHPSDMELAVRIACEGPGTPPYPTAPSSCQDFPRSSIWPWQRRDGDHKRALSLYLHLPFAGHLLLLRLQ